MEVYVYYVFPPFFFSSCAKIVKMWFFVFTFTTQNSLCFLYSPFSFLCYNLKVIRWQQRWEKTPLRTVVASQGKRRKQQTLPKALLSLFAHFLRFSSTQTSSHWVIVVRNTILYNSYNIAASFIFISDEIKHAHASVVSVVYNNYTFTVSWNASWACSLSSATSRYFCSLKKLFFLTTNIIIVTSTSYKTRKQWYSYKIYLRAQIHRVIKDCQKHILWGKWF